MTKSGTNSPWGGRSLRAMIASHFYPERICGSLKPYDFSKITTIGDFAMVHPIALRSTPSERRPRTSHRNLALFTGALFALGSQAIALAIPAQAPEQLQARSTNTAQKEKPVDRLEPDKPIEREVAGGQAHSYQLTLAADQYLRLVVNQRGIDVVVRFFGPDGKELLEADGPTGAQGPEALIAVTKTAGNYRVEVASLEKDARPGRYEVRLVEVRVATRQDKDRAAAQNLSAEGRQLAEQGTKAGFEAAIKKQQEALTLYRAAGDREGEADVLGNIGFFYSNLGEMQNALNYYQQALPILHAAGDKFAETERLNDAGEVCIYLGDLEKALAYFTQALPLCR